MNENELNTVVTNEEVANNDNVVKGAVGKVSAALAVGVASAALGAVSLGFTVGTFILNKVSTKKARRLINKLRKENLSDEDKAKIIDELFTKYGVTVDETGVIIQ